LPPRFQNRVYQSPLRFNTVPAGKQDGITAQRIQQQGFVGFGNAHVKDMITVPYQFKKHVAKAENQYVLTVSLPR